MFAPENTMVAMRLGADVLEADLNVTSDDVPILIHDATLERTGDVQTRPLAEVRACGAAYWWVPGADPGLMALPTLDAHDCILRSRHAAADRVDRV